MGIRRDPLKDQPVIKLEGNGFRRKEPEPGLQRLGLKVAEVDEVT